MKINQNVIKKKLQAQLENDKGKASNFKDGGRLYPLYIFANVVFPELVVSTWACCVICLKISQIWVNLVGYVQKTTYLAGVRARGKKLSAGNLCGLLGSCS